MKKALALLLVWCACVTLAGAQDFSRKAPAPPYTMATYQLLILKPGPAAPKLGGTDEGQRTVQAHVLYMYGLAKEGTYVAAGPFLDGGDISGIIVVRATAERAK